MIVLQNEQSEMFCILTLYILLSDDLSLRTCQYADFFCVLVERALMFLTTKWLCITAKYP